MANADTSGIGAVSEREKIHALVLKQWDAAFDLVCNTQTLSEYV